MDSQLDSSDHVTSFHPNESNQLSEKFSFFTTILQFFRLLLEIFVGISVGYEEETVWTSDFMLHEDEDVTEKISDAVEHEDEHKVLPPAFESGAQTAEIKGIIQSDFISPVNKDQHKVLTPAFESGVQTAERKDIIQSDFISPVNKDQHKVLPPGFGRRIDIEEIRDTIRTEIKDRLKNFKISIRTCLPSELKTNKNYSDEKIQSTTTSDAGSSLKTELKTNKDYTDQKIKSTTTTDASSCLKTESKTNKDYTDQKIKSTTTTDAGSCLKTKTKTNKDYTDQKIKSTTTTDTGSCLKTESKINKDYTSQNIKSTTTTDAGSCLKTETKTNKDYADHKIKSTTTTGAGSRLKANKDYADQKIKSTTTSDADSCLKTELKTNKICADKKIKSTTTTDAGSCLKTNKDYTDQKIKSTTTTNTNSCLKTESKINKDYTGQKIKSTTTTDAGSCLKANKDYADQKIKSTTSSDAYSCLKTELKTNKDCADKKIKSTTTTGAGSCLKTNTDYVDQKIKSTTTSDAGSCLKTESKTNKDYTDQTIKSTTTTNASSYLQTELKINADYADQKIKSTTATDAGKQDGKDEYSKGQNRSAQYEEEVKMAAINYKGNINDLDKDSKAVKRTKGSFPNIPSEKNESCWADAVEQEECITAGVGPFMCNLFEKQLFTDVTFYFKETKSFFSAHRVVLAARCDYFEKLLFGKQMNDASGMEMHVQINDVPLNIFTSIVKYLYTDAVKLDDDYEVLDTFRAAKMYRIHQLINSCKVYINTIELTENNACSMLELSVFKNIFELKTRCIHYIQKNTSQVFRSKNFETCCYSTVREICQQDVLNLNSEGELLEAVLRWVDLQKISKQGKEDYRRGLLKRVRFLSFTPREFSEVLQKHPNLLTPEEGLKILMILNNPCHESLSNLPRWCNKQAVRRTIQAGQTSIPESVAELDDKRWINISLKPLEKPVQSSPLICRMHLKCLYGAHHITQINFSLDNVVEEGCAFDISVAVTPNGTSFHKTYLAKWKENVVIFEKPIAVQAGQIFGMEAKSESQQRCQFLQFDKWYSNHLDFMCYFISEPETDKLYFISGIKYEPV